MRRPPLRRSLLIRLLASSVLVVGCAIAATAWLAVQSTTRAIQQAQGQALTDDAHIYDTLLGYAATHPSWDGVHGLVGTLARETGRRIVLTTESRSPVAASAGAPPALPRQASAVIDPLHTDPVLHPGTADRIDPRAVGPYRLTPAERQDQRQLAGEIRQCLRDHKLTARTVESPTGRYSVEIPDAVLGYKLAQDNVCGVLFLNALAPSEQRALHRLNALVNTCLRQQGLADVTLEETPTLLVPGDDHLDSPPAQTCLKNGQREQLARYVAPSALLFVAGPSGSTPSRFDLSRTNITRIVGVTSLVLAVTVAVTTLIATRLVRPLRALTAAAHHTDGAFHRVPVKGRDEISVLAAALNSLAERRERAESQRKAMVSDIAHELRTPLTNIRSWLEASEDGLAGPVSDPALTATLLREAGQLQHIVDDLQDLAVADAGGLPLHPEQVHLSGLLGHVISAHSGSADAAGVTLLTTATGDPRLTADPRRLHQAVGNLVANAVRYTPAGGRVSVHGETDGTHVRIIVADTGTGIAAEDLPHVFDRFWRADRSRSRETGGSGLGLAIVRQIAQAHGGTVGVTSTPGEGTAFTLRLPEAAPFKPPGDPAA